ncbi:MAG: 16S rRNA (cytosine(967)-C(5))-methyltransferase RsmB [Acidobacteriaceae bacterium]
MAAARRAAFEVLLEVGAGRGHSDDLLHSSRLGGLSAQDRNLATALVMGVLRWQIALDARLRTLLARPDQRMAEEVWLALRMGAFQLLHMDRIPAHAALSESVAICRAAGQEHAAGMVNAVLRRLTREPVAAGVKLYETAAALAERLGHPAWMVERWAGLYGRAAAIAICEGNQREPGRSAMFAEGQRSPEDGEGVGGDDAADAGLSGARGFQGMPVIDAGSRLVAEIAAAALPAVEGRPARVWDCCAAPGGKTMVLASRLGDAEILASDVSERRMRAMEQRLGRLAASAGDGGRVRCLTGEVEGFPVAEGVFDLVLCDVPCSGTGTLARNPEIRHRLRLEDIARQSTKQQKIVAAALRRVAPGGRMVYSTCSLEPEECEAVVAAVASGWRRLPMAAWMQVLQDRGIFSHALGWQSMVREEHLRTLPGVHGCDGFYAVVLERA